MNRNGRVTFLLITTIMLLVVACQPAPPFEPVVNPTPSSNEVVVPETDANAPAEVAAVAETVSFTLETVLENGFAFKGVGGEIDGVLNPELRVPAGVTVEITVVNGDGMQHNLTIDSFGVKTPDFMEQGSEQTLSFVANQGGDFEYYCGIAGHKQAGMFGRLIVEGDSDTASAESVAATGGTAYDVAASAPVEHAEALTDVVSIIPDATDVPTPVGEREAQTVSVTLETIEVNGQLADGTTYHYWTFNGTVPGPLLRVRVGDTVDVRLQNHDDSAFAHSVDFHAATGYLGGGEVTQTAPGDETVFSFKALNPGVYVYHCATPMVAHHIANGMYGLIIVEPEGGLPPVDREFYVMQGEIYSMGQPGDTGHLDFDVDALVAERPNYLVFNGATNGLSGDNALRTEVGETVRIYMGVGGPNLISSFHVIGEVFDRVYELASLTSEPLTNVQTVLVPPGGATVVEFTVEQPGTYLLVDHALSRAVKGLAGQLVVEGTADPTVSEGVSSGPMTEH